MDNEVQNSRLQGISQRIRKMRSHLGQKEVPARQNSLLQGISQGILKNDVPAARMRMLAMGKKASQVKELSKVPTGGRMYKDLAAEGILREFRRTGRTTDETYNATVENSLMQGQTQGGF